MPKPIEETVAEIAKDLPRFDDGRIDYTLADKAPVINAAVFCGDELLITKRSEKLNFYPGLWNGISGFIDELKPVEEQVKQELKEELGVGETLIERVAVGPVIERKSTRHDRLWMIYPFLVEFKSKPDVKLDWEHTDYKWINPEDLTKYEILKDFNNVVKVAIKLRNQLAPYAELT